MALVLGTGLMGRYLRVRVKMTRCMGKEFKLGLMEADMKEITKTILGTVMEPG